MLALWPGRRQVVETVHIEVCGPDMLDAWAGMRHALWPAETLENLRREAAVFLAREDRIAFMAREGEAVAGFAEASLREYVNGCEGSPVAFVEGLYVEPGWRRRGVARALIAVIEDWARARGLNEMGSDVLLQNAESQAAHGALGFSETERVVYYRKRLAQ
jgi:aminoglycoside 6'-N-acetyltransferase I